jgi:choline-sulfatase
MPPPSSTCVSVWRRETTMSRPNILFLMSDEHRADVAGFAGNSVIRTPVLDELAQNGVVFTNAYTPSPICIPGRQSLMAGKFPRHCGVERYGQDLPPGSLTFARQLARFAYRTVCAGKLHHMGPDQMQGWTKRLAGDMEIDDAFVPERDDDSYTAIRSVVHGPSWKWSDAEELKRARAADRSRNQVFDAIAAQATVDFVRDYFVDMTYDRATPTRPLLLKVSLLQPHYPYVTEEARLRYYMARVKPYRNEPVFDHPFLSQRAVRVPEDVTERDVLRATAAYYGMVESVDTHFGTVLDALRDVGQDLDDWIIVYTSDHGEMLGQHGIWEKQKFFEASAKVPLIIRWPRRFAPRIVTENVNLCDLFATFCDLADVPTPEGLDSRSLVPLLEGRSEGWDNETVSQFGGRNLMIKRDALKYQWYGTAMPEVLFDLDADPGETRNVIEEPLHADSVTRFRQQREELGFS